MDDHTRCTWVHLFKNKSDAFILIQAFVKCIQNQFNITLKAIRTNNAFELGTSNKGVHFFQNQGIFLLKSCPHTPQQFGLLKGSLNISLKYQEHYFFNLD